MQILLPTEEDSLVPLFATEPQVPDPVVTSLNGEAEDTDEEFDESERDPEFESPEGIQWQEHRASQEVALALAHEATKAKIRVAPSLWNIPTAAVSLTASLPLLATLDPAQDDVGPALRCLIQATRIATKIVERQSFAPSPAANKHALRHVIVWNEGLIRAVSALAELVPDSLLTARRTKGHHDDPVHGQSPRSFIVTLLGHAVDVLATQANAIPGHTEANRLPKSFWQARPQPVLEVIVPKEELEEGVPWGIQMLLRPIPGIQLFETIESLRWRHGQCLFPDPMTAESLRQIEESLEKMAEQLPPLRRAINLTDGRASLNRAELDQILDHFPMLEAEGVEVTLPGYEGLKRVSAKVSIVEEDTQDELDHPWFELDWSIAVGDMVLADGDLDKLLDSKTPLVHLESGPVILSPKDRAALEEFKKRAQDGGNRISFFEALRLKLGGATHLHGLALETLHSSPLLDRLVKNLDEARSVEDRVLPPGFVGELRPYQQRGHAWMYFLTNQGFGACLADDMGLGKTVQAIAVILDRRLERQKHNKPDPGPVLIVCPVSVLGNWRREVQRFAPGLNVTMHHGKLRAREKDEFDQILVENQIILTSYNLLQRDEELLSNVTFDGVILDEAQNIKNPNTRQSKAARKLRGHFRMALTGTPLENRPLDLWSIMDFLNEGLLGSKSYFTQAMEHPIVKQRNKGSVSMLAGLVRPFVLRRLKTDPDIITDLPEKTEQVVAATLTKEQASLYENVAKQGIVDVEKAGEGIARRGAILTTLLRLKQVCNHPSHYNQDGAKLPGRSGKLDLLTEMLTEALDEGDRCLVFTQFKEMGTLLKTHLENLMGGTVLFLHGGIPQKDRETMVNDFQEGREEGPKIFVLSLKAGGTGLNLTQANRVFHYDRWWNPAVEDQATDRAFRIGQQRNVFVHKFVCTGTLEERIQTMLERKREVADNLLAAGEDWITELSNEELRKLLALDNQEAYS